MLTEILVDFKTSADAKKSLTAFRKHYRVALRGSIVGSVTHRSGERIVGRIWVKLDNTGFSTAEFTHAIQAFIPVT